MSAVNVRGLRSSVIACGERGYLQPHFVDQVLALIDVAEAASNIAGLGIGAWPELAAALERLEFARVGGDAEAET